MAVAACALAGNPARQAPTAATRPRNNKQRGAPHPRKGKARRVNQKEYRMSTPNFAGEAFAEDDLPDMTDPATRTTWSDAGIAAFLESLRRLYGDDFVARMRLARIESDARAGDAARQVGGTTDCHECCEPQEITVRYAGQFRLACGHLVRA